MARRVLADDGVARSGKRSLKIEHPGPGETVVSSEPLTLAVGHVYRLTGWIVVVDGASPVPKRKPASKSSFMLTVKPTRRR